MAMCISCLQRPAGTEKSRVLCKPCETSMEKSLERFRKQKKIILAYNADRVSDR